MTDGKDGDTLVYEDDGVEYCIPTPRHPDWNVMKFAEKRAILERLFPFRVILGSDTACD